MSPETPRLCRQGHHLTPKTMRIIRHSKSGIAYRRCLICHAGRQKKFRVAEAARWAAEEKAFEEVFREDREVLGALAKL